MMLVSVFLNQSRLYTFVSLLLATGFLSILLEKRRGRLFFQAIPHMAALYSFVLSVQILMGVRWWQLFDNPTQAAWWIAITAPITLLWQSPPWAKLGIFSLFGAAILQANASTPILAFCPAVFLLFWQSFPRRYLIAGIVALAVFTFSRYSVENLIEPGARYEVWKLALDWWYGENLYRVFFGWGLGSVKVMIPHIQRLMGVDGPGTMYIWLHNDWLQVLCELGAVGLALALWCTAYLVKKAWAFPEALCSLVAYGIVMITQFPIHWPSTAMLGLFLVNQVLTHEEWISIRFERESS